MKTQKEIAEAIMDYLSEGNQNRYAIAAIVDEKSADIALILHGNNRNLTAMLGATMCQNEDFREVILSAVNAYHYMKKMKNSHADC